MIRKLKRKFVALAMGAMVVLLTLIVIGMNVITYNYVVREADRILIILAQNEGVFLDFDASKNVLGRYHMSPETPYETRYFSIFLNSSGEVVSTDLSNIVSVDQETAAAYAQSAWEKEDARGFVGQFRYIKRQEEAGWRIIFLDCRRRLDAFQQFLLASSGMALAGLLVVFFVVSLFVGKMLEPIAESDEKQKRFITDAGHEMKTPLTIIQTNADILEMELGENECLTDITQQTKRLRSLTDDLVMLARMEESKDSMRKIEFPISEVVAETVQPFRALAARQDKELLSSIQPMLTLKGNDQAIQQLVTIFLDNALKYSPPGSTITLDMRKKNKMIQLSVQNETESVIAPEQIVHVFDRFYRTDASRNSETGGHGIGLSIAQAIVAAHGGKIHACAPDGASFRILVSFPI
ncbi:MAG: HAMP domain-containing sensor histidine kinase [Eubacteriales bacterium]|nr:HAMP domain-containing sensor histidine kinase [Eubacteriales bacterium]